MTDPAASGKVAVVTGASRGLGRSMALHLARRGVGVVGTYRSARTHAHAVTAEIVERGGRALAVRLDVTDLSEIRSFAANLPERLDATFGRRDVDMLVNNAGAVAGAPFADTTEEAFDQMVDLHFKGPFFLSQAMLPLLIDGGRILNVSTGLTRFTVPGVSAYAAANGALEVLTRFQAKELADRRIRVNVLAPGAIATDLGGGVARDDPAVVEYLSSVISLGRVGQPDDVGAAVAALLSDDMGWITGTRIEVSGGQAL